MALAIYGHVQSFLLKRYDRAVTYLERAVQAGPSSAMAWSMSSATRGFLGDGPLAVQHAEQGLRLSPLGARIFWHEGILAQSHYVNGAYEEAVTWAYSAIARNNAIRFNHRTLIASLVALGRLDEASGVARRFLNLQPNFSLSAYAKRCAFQEPILTPWIERLRAGGLPD
jgi:adenylate cyclase